MVTLDGQLLCILLIWVTRFLQIDNLSKRKIESEYGIEPINSVKFFKIELKFGIKIKKIKLIT